jgi:hypothetical protein
MTPRSSFGTIATGIVYFDVLYDDGAETIPDWTDPVAHIATNEIPGSNPPIVERELVATGDSSVTWRLEFASRQELARMRSKRLSTDTLTIPYSLQSHVGVYEDRPEGAVESLHHTTLVEISNVQTYPDGVVEADATFTRLIDPSTGEALP